MGSDLGGSAPRNTVRRLWATGILILAAGVLAGSGHGGEVPPVASGLVRAAVWFSLMVLPGLGVYLVLERDRRNLADAALSSLGLSPVLAAGVAMLVLVVSGNTRGLTPAIVIPAAVLAAAGCLRSRGGFAVPPRRETLGFLLLLAAAVVLTATLPLTREWWRVRSDAWFHAAVILQIRDLGAPPGDPYFAGLELQYMWAYHAMVLALSQGLDADPFRIMALVNAHALALLCVAAYRLAAVFRAEAAPRLAAVAMTLFGFNAAFWVFFPAKAATALTGEVRGGAELSRTFRLTPLDYDTARAFLTTFRNPEFFLDKFMVATAFGIALALLLTGLAAACAHLAAPRGARLALVCGAASGALWFHVYVGMILAGALCGAAGLVFLFRSRVRGYTLRPFLHLALVTVLAAAVSAPFLYRVTHGKESAGGAPLNLSVTRAAAIFIPCALVFLLAWRERRLRTDPSPAARFLVSAALLTLGACLLIRLPGANDVAKPAFPVFLTLAGAAGFAVADACVSRRGRARLAAAAFWIVLFALPVNAIALASAYAGPDGVAVTADESRVAAWVRDHTPRGAVFLDEPGSVFLLVAGPRRYLFGSLDYARQWGYPRAEMARRLHAVQSLYHEGEPDAGVLSLLASLPDPAYLVVRPAPCRAGAPVCVRDDLFPKVFESGGIQVREVNRAACLEAVPAAAETPSDEALIRETGL